jgi:hypothetical protein
MPISSALPSPLSIVPGVADEFHTLIGALCVKVSVAGATGELELFPRGSAELTR